MLHAVLYCLYISDFARDNFSELIKICTDSSFDASLNVVFNAYFP